MVYPLENNGAIDHRRSQRLNVKGSVIFFLDITSQGKVIKEERKVLLRRESRKEEEQTVSNNGANRATTIAEINKEIESAVDV